MCARGRRRTFRGPTDPFRPRRSYVSRDGRRLVTCGQWHGADAIAAMRQHPEMPAYFERIKAIAQMEAMTCDMASIAVA